VDAELGSAYSIARLVLGLKDIALSYPYLLGLAPDLTSTPTDDGVELLNVAGSGVRVDIRGPGVSRLLERLAQAPNLADDLCDDDPARLHYLLLRLGGRGLLSYTVAGERWSARLDPTSPRFAAGDDPVEGRYRLSRFACLRRLDDTLAIECPLGHARVVLEGGPALAMIGLLAQPRSAEELAAETGVGVDAARGFLGLLVMAGSAFGCDAEGRLPEDRQDALRQWEFHDLLFHVRNRLGRREHRDDTRFRFKGQIEGLPPLKPAMSGRRVALPTPDEGAVGTFQALTDRRRSRRGPGDAPITLAALGAFLHRSARVREALATPPEHGVYEASLRPAASGGAAHGLELYLTVHRAVGLETGFYHYAPSDHALERLADLEGAPAGLLAVAAKATYADGPPDVLITLAARFARYSWKYQALAYALILKDAGALTQQMYLAATDLGLRPCGVGTGDSDLFAQAAGTDYFAETSVAEFTLSGA
jgi:SagB-type dehydrogenase family enzyme